MKIYFKHLFFLVPFSLFLSSASAQYDLPASFVAKKEAVGFELSTYAEVPGKMRPGRENEICDYDLELSFPEKGLDIRYRIEPIKDEKSFQNWPEKASILMASTVTSNAEDEYLSGHYLEGEDLMPYNADWGLVVIFTPKQGFSTKRYGKMYALFKEGRGIVYLFYLFNNPGAEIDAQLPNVRFLEIEKTK